MTPELPDDSESLLTAYLDGELDPARRSSIATALSSDPDLAEQLRRLSSVRGLVAGLSRPALPADLSAAIAGRMGRTSRHARRRRVAALTVGGLALAATVLLA